MRRAAVAFAVAAACVALLSAQQEPPPVFRVEVDAIEIDAFVTDAQGTPVTDLAIDDFELLEDGVPQTIASLSLVTVPIERVERPLIFPTPIEPDVFTNQGPEGRLYVFALDEVEGAMALRTRHFMRRFVEQHFAANDVAAVVWMGRGLSRNTQDFTSNRRLLLDAIDRFEGGFGGFESVNARGMSRTPTAVDPLSQARAFRALAESMAKLQGRRKTLVWVTEAIGDAYEVLDYTGGVRSLAFDEFHAAMTAATRGNVSVYPINPRGLDPEGTGMEFLDQMMNFRALAEATGGRALTNSNTFDVFFERLVRENSTYYVLGFTSSNDRRDGRYRRLQVRVKRPGLDVRARDGYVAPLRRTTPEPRADAGLNALIPNVARAISNPVVTRGVPMAVFAAPYKSGRRGQASVAIVVEMDVERLGLVTRGDTVAGEIQVASVAINAAGRIFDGQRHRLELALKPDTWTIAREHGFRVLTGATLPPGRYQLRIAAGGVGGRAAGSVMYDLEIPDFTKDPLVMSGVSLASDSTGRAVTSAPDAPLRDLLPLPPTAAREFDRGDTLMLYAEVYQNRRGRVPNAVTLTAELRDDAGRVLQTVSEERSSKELAGQAGGYGFRASLPLTDAAPGIYVVHVAARANIGDQPSVTRDIQIRVK
jgi:VWFA-related protein